MERSMSVVLLRTYPILIESNGRVHDTDCRKTLNLSEREQVEWIASGPGTWRVYFDRDSPFATNDFEVSMGSPVQSGRPRANAALKAYKYRVLDQAGETRDDPDILIES